MDYYTFVATVSLVFQVGVFGLLLGSLVLKARKNMWLHGVTMLVGLLLHFISIGAIMVPSFVLGIIPFAASSPTDATVLLSFVHAVTGIIAPISAVWIIASWRLRKSLEYCAPKKKLMKATLGMWLVALLSGVALYLSFYWTTLFG